MRERKREREWMDESKGDKVCVRERVCVQQSRERERDAEWD
jgi:hypothetical protein